MRSPEYEFLATRATAQAAAWTVIWCIYAVLIQKVFAVSIDTMAIVDATLVIVLSMTLGLRVNRAYERWWEGRKLWGTLVNVSRNLAVKARVYGEPDAKEAPQLHHEVAGFAAALCAHLRDGVPLARIAGFEDSQADPKHVPAYLVGRIYERLHSWVESGRISQEQLRMLDRELRVFLDVCGACERIRNSDFPATLIWLTRFGNLVAGLMAPVVLIQELGNSVIPLAGVGVFLIFLAESSGTLLQRPFGGAAGQLDLDRLVGVIEQSTGEILEVDATAAASH